jgi:ABC-2 type transport system permease protein
MPRLHVIGAVFQRNFWSYFSGVIGYLFIVVFVLAASQFAFSEQFFTNNLANLDQLNKYFPFLLLFIVPAITMGVWAEEKKLGTDELLFTLPVSDVEVLVAKYLAVVAVYTVVLLFSMAICLVLQFIGSPDWGLIATTYFGYWLAGCALLSAGMVASFLTNSSTVAFVLGTVICAVPVFIGQIPAPSGLVSSRLTEIPVIGGLFRGIGHMLTYIADNRLLEHLSIAGQFQPFGIGMVPLVSVLYFASFTGLMLYLNLVLIGERHWAGGARGTNMSLQYAVRTVCLALILFSVNVVLANVNWRLDRTSERLYTLTDTTAKLLRETTADRPVTIQAFVSQDVPREYVAVRTSLLGLLAQFQSYKHINVRVVNVSPFSKEADEAKQYGIEPRKVQSERGGRISVDDVFLGLVVNSGANEVIVPFLDTAIPIEYELTRSVRTAAKETRRTVGILDTDAKLNGGFDFQSGRSSPEWRIVAELKKQYKVETVPANMPIDEKKYDVVLAVLPSSLDQQGLQNFVDYVKTGRPVLIFDDPFPAFNPGAAPRQPKPRPGGMFGGGMPPEQKADGGKATSLVNLLGIQWIYDRVVWDKTILVLHPEYADVVRPEMVAISRKSGMDEAFSPRSEITNGLQELLCFFAGTLEKREGTKLKFEPLLRTGRTSGLLMWDDFVESSMFGGLNVKENPRRPIDDLEHVVAAEIQSEKDAKEKIHAIYVADSDIISDWFFMVRERRMYGLDLDNVNFVLNAVDSLAGDEDFIALRKRRPKHRTLTRVEQETSKFIEQSAKERESAAEEAKLALDKAKDELKKKVKTIQDDESLDEIEKFQRLAIAQQEEQRKLDVQQAEIDQKKERTIDEIRARTEREVRQIEHRYYLLATVIPPIPAVLWGFVFWIMRLLKEKSEVPPTRRRAAA